MRHVADRIKMDQEAYTRHHREHNHREVIDRERKVDMKAGDLNPRARHNFHHQIARAQHRHPKPAHQQRRDRRKQKSDARDGRTRQFPPQRSIDQEAKKGKQRDPPEQGRRHRFRSP